MVHPSPPPHLPALALAARPPGSFYATWQYSWTTKRTLWLALAWLFVFVLAVGLLVGLLVPWGELTATTYVYGPAVVDTTPYGASVALRINRAATLYYAVVPAAYTDLLRWVGVGVAGWQRGAPRGCCCLV